MAEDTRKKSGVGSGNMSTPATTSANASSSGYGYSPLYESIAQLSGFTDSIAMMEAAAGGSSGAATGDNSYNPDGTKYTDQQLAAMTPAERKAAVDSYNPTMVAGVDVEKTLAGIAASTVANAAIPFGFGLPGLAASFLAKQLIQGNRDTNQLSLESYMKGVTPSAAEETERGVTPVTEVTRDAIVAGSTPKVAEDTETTDPLATWLNANYSSSGQTSAPSNGSVGANNTYSGSGYGNSAGPGSNYSSPSSSGD